MLNSDRRNLLSRVSEIKMRLEYITAQQKELVSSQRPTSVVMLCVLQEWLFDLQEELSDLNDQLEVLVDEVELRGGL